MTEPPPDPRAVARDWITIWQSELAALAADREAQEAFQRLVGFWADFARGSVAAWPEPAPGPGGATGGPDGGGDGGPPGRSRPDAPSRPAPADAAPGAGGAGDGGEVGRLTRRVAELERRLGRLESGGTPGDEPAGRVAGRGARHRGGRGGSGSGGGGAGGRGAGEGNA